MVTFTNSLHKNYKKKRFLLIKFKKGSGGDISIPVYWFFGGSEVNYWCPHYQTNLGDYSVALWGCYLLSFQTGIRGGHLYIFGEIVPTGHITGVGTSECLMSCAA